MRHLLPLLLLGLAAAPTPAADDVQTLLKKAREEAVVGNTEQALRLADEAVKAAPNQAAPYVFRAALREQADRYDDAVADLTAAIKLDPKNAVLYDARGSVEFKRGKIEASIADFDRYLALRPDQTPGHWKRGISYYYAGKFDEGRKQFEGYEQVDTNDVENAVWHFLCVARKDGVKAAREKLLKIGNDRRVPMMQVYELFAGKLQPADVLRAAEEGTADASTKNRQLFYAHLYLGLYAEVQGDKAKALQHLTTAADKHRIGHYMWDVARVHRDLLKKASEKP